MADEVNYEIFCRRDAKSPWTLEAVITKRDDAIKQASALVARGRAGARVVKQAYDPKTSDFLSITIFEAGGRSLRLDPKAEDAPSARVCEVPQDFYARDARAVVSRLLGDYLARQRLTAGELMHRADALKVFEGTNAVFQHAVQRIAVVHSASSELPVQEIIKRMNALIIEAMHRVYHDSEAGRFVEAGPGQFGALARALADDEEGSYRLHGAIALHLRSAGTWDNKLARLIPLLEEAAAAGAGSALLRDSVDGIIEEILNISAALYELLGGRENVNTALLALVDLYLGSELSGAQPGLAALCAGFAAGQLPRARRTIAQRILAELKSTKRLCPTSVMDEIKALRRIASSLMAAIGPDFDPEDLAAAFTLRSRRIVTQPSLNEIIANAVTPDEKLERLLFVLDNVVGTDNKRQLASFLMPMISGGTFESFFLAARPSAAAAIRRLAEHQARVMRSSFPPAERDDIASLLDRLAVQVEVRNDFFKGIEGKMRDPVEKALFYVNLCKGGVTEGRLSSRVRKTVLDLVTKPQFLGGYAARLQKTEPGADPRTELLRLLDGTGIDEAKVRDSMRSAA